MGIHLLMMMKVMYGGLGSGNSAVRILPAQWRKMHNISFGKLNLVGRRFVWMLVIMYKRQKSL
jgi:hypothetical protein